ncbi:MAG: hypothetical protein RXQ97_03265 [Caldivirga sp.]
MNRIDSILLIYTVAVAALVLIFLTNIGFSTFIAFSRGLNSHVTISLPLDTIVVNDNPNGIVFVTITPGKLYYLLLETSVISSILGLMLLLLARLMYGSSMRGVLSDGKAILKLLIPASLLALGLLLMIPLPISIYLSNGYVVVMTNAGVVFSGLFLLLSSISLLTIAKMYSGYGDLTELAVEIELTESNTMPMEYDEATSAS